MDQRDDILFGKIALNKRLIRRDLLNRALQYQRAQAPQQPLGEILLEKGILTKAQVDEILAFQARVKHIKASSGASVPAELFQSGVPSPPPSPAPGAGWPGASAPGQQPPAQSAPSPAFHAAPGDVATTVMNTPDPEQDALIGEVVGGCVINAKIGAGGMGAIYLARHEALRKDVVVKILPPESAANPRTVERFFREARAAAKLEHPNIVQVQDVGTTERGLHYIIMQYVDGKNLEEVLQNEGRMGPDHAVRIVLQIASGLRVAHAAGVIHRDIKAENILFTPQRLAKLTDFGLAKDLNSELKLTADGAMIGTPLYMAPEIGRVKEIDGRVDIYSLGVTFYYLLTGVQPFRGFSALEILSAKAHDQLKPPDEHMAGASLPDPHYRVLGKMLEKDRDLRYPDVDSLVRDLEALERNLPIDAGEPTIWPPREQVRNATAKPKATGSAATKGPRPRSARRGAAAGSSGGGSGAALVLLLIGAVLLILGLIGVLAWILLG